MACQLRVSLMVHSVSKEYQWLFYVASKAYHLLYQAVSFAYESSELKH